MTALARHAQDYLALRRALGFKLGSTGRLLGQFADFAERSGLDTVTVVAALAWARSPQGASPSWVAKRLSVVRGFARYLQAIDARAEIPPPAAHRAQARRSTPYIYSDDEIARLMAAARALRNPLKAATFETLLGLIAVTGLRGGEAMHLDRHDFDPGQHLLTVRNSKFGKTRQLVLHASTAEALCRYGARRDELCPSPAAPALFLSSPGTRLSHPVLQATFAALLQRAGVGVAAARRPRVHDLRHSFTVKTLLGWYRDGLDVQPLIPALSAYLGHADPGDTYWYLTGTPELLTLAAERLEATSGRTS
jgi:integrase/recombinase XerD